MAVWGSLLVFCAPFPLLCEHCYNLAPGNVFRGPPWAFRSPCCSTLHKEPDVSGSLLSQGQLAPQSSPQVPLGIRLRLRLCLKLFPCKASLPPSSSQSPSLSTWGHTLIQPFTHIDACVDILEGPHLRQLLPCRL